MAKTTALAVLCLALLSSISGAPAPAPHPAPAPAPARTGRHLLAPAPQPAPATASTDGKTYYVLQYKYVSDILEKRGPYRDGHLNAIRKGIADSKVILGGALADPVDGALITFVDVTKDEVDAYAKADPYFLNGLIQGYNIRLFQRVQ